MWYKLSSFFLKSWSGNPFLSRSYTFPQIRDGELLPDPLDAGLLQLVHLRGRDVRIEGVDKVSHDADEDPVAPVVKGPLHHVVVELLGQGLVAGQHLARVVRGAAPTLWQLSLERPVENNRLRKRGPR